MSRAKVLVAAVAVVLFYGLLSALLTVGFERWGSTGLLVADGDSLWRLRPGFTGAPGFVVGESGLTPVRIDARGFRNGAASAPGARRETILTIGDSFTFGWDVADDETYPAQLQVILDARVPGRFAVINGGMPGCTSFQAARLLRRWMPLFHPAVVVALLGRNDGRPTYLSDRASQAILGWKPDLLDKVFPFMFLHYRNLQALASATGRGAAPRVSDQEFADNMQRIAETVRSGGARLIVMEHWKRNPAFGLARFAAAHDLPYIDAPQLLAHAATGGEELFIRAHYHPNRKGYAVLAAALAEQILASDARR